MTLVTGVAGIQLRPDVHKSLQKKSGKSTPCAWHGVPPALHADADTGHLGIHAQDEGLLSGRLEYLTSGRGRLEWMVRSRSGSSPKACFEFPVVACNRSSLGRKNQARTTQALT